MSWRHSSKHTKPPTRAISLCLYDIRVASMDGKNLFLESNVSPWPNYFLLSRWSQAGTRDWEGCVWGRDGPWSSPLTWPTGSRGSGPSSRPAPSSCSMWSSWTSSRYQLEPPVYLAINHHVISHIRYRVLCKMCKMCDRVSVCLRRYICL